MIEKGVTRENSHVYDLEVPAVRKVVRPEEGEVGQLRVCLQSCAQLCDFLFVASLERRAQLTGHAPEKHEPD